ncbi:MAG: RNA 3'-terminal phosphate cyclase, partial [Halobacteria archaeon]|nr:RNA 3'-terminal phosphate cyclase [Halobacteria archaeon]
MPLKIDGSHGEGGGQILRTSLALSAVTGEAVEVHDVRAERETPGLKRQHLAVVDAIAEMSDADVEGDDEGSERVLFDPSEVTGGEYTVDVGTAGSVTLVAQSAILASVGADSTVELVIRGGTDVKWSPTYAYLEHVTLPLLETIGVEAESRLVRRGHYPEGGGEISLVVEPSYPEPTRLTRRGELRRVEGLS